MHFHRNTATVIGDRDRAIAVQRDRHRVAVAGQGLVDRVVHDLIDHMMQTRPIVGVADIHTRPLANGIEALQDLDRIRAVFFRNLASVGAALGGIVTVLAHSIIPSRKF